MSNRSKDASLDIIMIPGQPWNFHVETKLINKEQNLNRPPAKRNKKKIETTPVKIWFLNGTSSFVKFCLMCETIFFPFTPQRGHKVWFLGRYIGTS